VKCFATLELLELAKDRIWLAKMTNGAQSTLARKNATKRDSGPHLQSLLGAESGDMKWV
jgi:hypothetical protein